MAANPPVLESGRSLDRGLLSDQIYQLLVDAISSGELQPGQRVVESEIARRFSVSQAPVREAVKRLANSGMVLQLPRRGSFVATIDEQTARRAYKLRAVLEEHAAREFCQFADKRAADELSTILASMKSAAKGDDLRGVIECDIEFHRTVWESTGDVLLARMWPLVEGSLRAFTTISNRLYFGSLTEIAQTHDPLVDALRRRDSNAAGSLFHDHVTAVWERVDQAAAEARKPG